MGFKKRYYKSDERNIQPNKSNTNNFREGSLDRKLKRQEREQARFDRETEALIRKFSGNKNKPS
jgi:hypothetical protein